MSNSRPSKHAHELIKETADKLCEELYDRVMHDNAVREQWKKTWPLENEEGLRKKFKKRYLPQMIEPARATLSGMLSLSLPDSLKESIYEALLLDATLVLGRPDHTRH